MRRKIVNEFSFTIQISTKIVIQLELIISQNCNTNQATIIHPYFLDFHEGMSLHCICLFFNKVIIIMKTEKSSDEESKVRSMLLQLNKVGLSYLKYSDFPQAISYFKKAEKIATQELIINKQDVKISQMAAITFNNLACYYKKTKKPKVALNYLQRCLEIEIYKLNDWISIGSTHLNICAIYSYLKKHEQALNHVDLALQLLDKQTYKEDDSTTEGKSYWNIKMLCSYNKAIEQEHLKWYSKSLQSYKLTKELAKLAGSKNSSFISICDEAISRIEANFTTLKQRMLSLLFKRQEDEDSGHYVYMRKNLHRQRKEQLNLKQFNTAQLVRSGDNPRLQRIYTTANKSSQADLFLSKNSSHAINSKRQNNRSKTEKADSTNYY